VKTFGFEIMRILGISGSHRKSGGTYRLLEEAMRGVKEEDQAVETRIIELAGLKISLCIATCGYSDGVGCSRNPFECNVKDDLQMVFEEMKQADGVMMASPRYFIVPSKLQAFIERVYCSTFWSLQRNPSMLSPLANKPFGILTTSSSDAYSAVPLQEHLEKFLLWLQMKPVTVKKWPFRGVHGQFPVSEDTNALELARQLGREIASVATKRT
jgi:multimeric flavodoxin WrbA